MVHIRKIPVPKGLKEIQHWFGGVVAQPLDEEGGISPCTPSGNPIKEEAKKYIVSSPTLAPWQCMEIYNKQYWWRLLNTIQEICPFLTRLFGYHDFNQTIAIPYLVAHRPNSWSLNPLGSQLPQWIEEKYDQADRDLVLNAAKIDIAFNNHFFTEELPPLSSSDLSLQQNMQKLLEIPLILQPHITLFHFPYDLFSFRTAILKEEPDYWIDQDFPELMKGNFHFVHFRTRNHDIQWKQITEAEYFFLSLLKGGTTINEACEILEQQSHSIRTEAAKQMSQWFHTWSACHWLTFSL